MKQYITTVITKKDLIDDKDKVKNLLSETQEYINDIICNDIHIQHRITNMPLKREER